MTITLQERYKQERDRRLNPKGLSQYLDRTKSASYGFSVDPWIGNGTPINIPVLPGNHCKIVIFGAGFGGLVAAARCLQSGAAKGVEDILIVDPAGGPGGTWYWNRYPGLMCDIESYIYLPLLEETGYMPKRKYASGLEIRQYADLIVKHYGLNERAMYQTTGNAVRWEEDHWICDLTEKPKGLPEKKLSITADFVVLGSGGLTYPKLPNITGLDDFKGDMFHTARWNYQLTGGSQSDPVMTNLSKKRVAIVGTGATAIQAVPEVAKYAKELYVFQRTPSAVDERNNHDTDIEEWKAKIATKKGWQAERAENFQIWTENHEIPPIEDLVNDGMTKMPSISGSFGSPRDLKFEDIPKFLQTMEELDRPRSERVRQRVLDIVKVEETAKSLQAWYPGWCKRPCFHDDYLPSFNLPSVHLIDTHGLGISSLTSSSIIANDQDFPLDIIIWSTGYGSPVTDSMAGKANMTVLGKHGIDMEHKFKSGDLMLLHGITGQNFPNLFSIGFAQAGVGVNQMQRMDLICKTIAHIISEGEKQANNGDVIIEPTEEACENWGNRVAGTAHLLATMAGCTPSYFTKEGEVNSMTMEQQRKAARSSLWGRGYMEYSRIVEEWRAKGDLEGLEIREK